MDGMDTDGSGGSSVPPARDPVFAARYLARLGLTLGAAAVPLPDAVVSMPPGPGLSAVLATVDVDRSHRGQLAQVLLARQRQACYEFAGLLATVWQWACAPVADGATVVRLDDASRWVAKELAPLLNCTVYRAEQLFVMARLAVRTAPALLAALRAGMVDESRVALIARELRGVGDEATIRAVVDQLLPDLATHTSTTLAEQVRRVLGCLDPESVRKTRQQRLDERDVVRRNGVGGLTRLVLGCFDAAAAAAAFEHVDRIARATVASGDGGGRTLGQVRADTALTLLTGADPGPAGAGRGQGVISLTVGLSTLVGLDDDHGVLAGYGPVTAQVARQVAARFAHASRWRFSLHDDRGDGRLLCDGPLSRAAVAELVTGLCRWVADDTGRHPVDASAGPAGRAHRDPTQVQKIFVRARDGHCQFPGCRVPARRCDIDHRVAWQDGGATIVSNLHCLCRTHHRFKHLHQLDYETTVAGIVWNLPNTRRYLKQHQPTPGIGRHRHQSGFGGVIVELAGYTHTSGPSPHLRQ